MYFFQNTKFYFKIINEIKILTLVSSALDLLSCIDLWRKINQLILHMNNKKNAKIVFVLHIRLKSQHTVCTNQQKHSNSVKENNLNLKRSYAKMRNGILKRSLYRTTSAKKQFDNLYKMPTLSVTEMLLPKTNNSSICYLQFCLYIQIKC